EARLSCAIAAEERPALAGPQRQVQPANELATSGGQSEPRGGEHQRSLVRSRSSAGTPIIAVSTPTGSSAGDATVRASVSANATRLPPRQAASGSSARCRGTPHRRRKGGTTSATEA